MLSVYCGLSLTLYTVLVIFNTWLATVLELTLVFYEESRQLLRRVSSFIELNGRKGESELRVFHARHTHVLLTAAIHVFRGRHAACTALSTNPLSSTAIRLHPQLQVDLRV